MPFTHHTRLNKTANGAISILGFLIDPLELNRNSELGFPNVGKRLSNWSYF